MIHDAHINLFLQRFYRVRIPRKVKYHEEVKVVHHAARLPKHYPENEHVSPVLFAVPDLVVIGQ